MAQNTYIFNELDKRALIGILVLETIHKNIKFKPVTSASKYAYYANYKCRLCG